MLGRQQIAGIQNAVSELFKNAHDAYAKHACVDYFEDSGANHEGFVVVRDDGVGMTREDFEEKWLVLGTESKTAEKHSQQYRPPDMSLRPITGEKGIGRLSIALLGRQVLVLTRAVRQDRLHDLVMALVHWGLFEQPGLNLEEIEVPISTFRGGTLPGPGDVRSLRERLIKCVKKLATEHVALNLNVVMQEIERFAPDPTDLDNFFASRDSERLSLAEKGTGTHFLIGPSNTILKIEIDSEIQEKDYSFRKQLLGFCNETFGEETAAPLTTSFRRWLPGDVVGEDLLDPTIFFTRDELTEKSDHLLAGDIDGFGQFKGSLRVYDKQHENVIVPWGGSGGKPTKCGPFRIMFGYLMGRPTESVVSEEEFRDLNNKLDNLGGMYVYRDRIRILPYGDHSYDWLEVEKRRTKGAGYYFFSFRRMFGAVILTRRDNDALQEKAGREGFQQNEAYRQLREILRNLLIQLAAEFFRKGGAHADLFERTQAEVRRRAEALERQQKRATAKRKNFANALAGFSNETSSGLPDTAVANLRKLTQARMEAASKIPDHDKAAAALIRAEQEAVTQLNALRSKYTCKRPPGVALTRELSREWDAYQVEKNRLDTQVFNPFEDEIARALGEVAKQARIYVDQRRRLEERIKLLADERKKELAEASQQANATASDTRQTVFNITEKARLALDQTIHSIEVDLNSTDLGALEPAKIEEMRKRWEERLTDIEVRHRDALMAARDMLAALAENLRGSDGEEPAQIMEALEERMLSLEEQADEDFEMVQLGLAVAIINHEFAASIRRVRRSVQELGQISRKSQALRPLYESIRTNFEHLDGHLNLFTPLQRRLYRTAQVITGKSVRNYVSDLFSNRFERHKIKFECTDAFLDSQVECYPSTLYPAVINLVDNALYWLSSTSGERIIKLDATNDSLLICNNGPAIEERDSERIFERGYSRKPGGRGLGLFISARALQGEHMKLSVDIPPAGFNVAFRIAIPNLRHSS
ncbi:MAG: ATP-binding protein [Verrucomicrobiales bacterium]|nr:ATP-binding protein [Verrucomicrobiales bacterium]